MEEGVEDAQNGYECSEGTVVVFDDSVTTVEDGDPFATGYITLSAPLADTIEVEFNGTTYTLTGIEDDGCKIYGEPYNPDTGEYDWSQYPFNIIICPNDGSEHGFTTQTAGTYALKISQVSENISTTECFEKAVKNASSLLLAEDSNDTLDKTWQEIHDALKSGKTVYVETGDSIYSVNSVVTGDVTGTYYVKTMDEEYIASSSDGYPEASKS